MIKLPFPAIAAPATPNIGMSISFINHFNSSPLHNNSVVTAMLPAPCTMAVNGNNNDNHKIWNTNMINVSEPSLVSNSISFTYDKTSIKPTEAATPNNKATRYVVWIKGFSPRPFFLVDRKSTRLNSSHVSITYPFFCLKKQITKVQTEHIHVLF